MSLQVSNTCRSCYASLRDIGKIRHYLSEECTKTLIQAYVSSKLDILNSLLFGCPGYLIRKLQLIQNHAARLIAKKKKFDHIEAVRMELHWLPIKYRIECKILFLVFKSLPDLFTHQTQTF